MVTFFDLKVPDYESAMLIYSKYIRSYDAGRSFDPIFMKFTWLVRVHSWVSPIVFGNNRPNRTTDMGENVSTKTGVRGHIFPNICGSIVPIVFKNNRVHP